MKNKDEKSILNLSKAYQRAEESILKAVNSHKASNVKDYQKLVNKAVSDAVKMLADKNKKFVERELPKAFSEGQKEVQGHTPTVHTVMTAKDVSVILRQAGFRYSGKGLQYDTYIEVQKATENAGKGFLSRVNKKIKELEKNGEDTLYNVEQAVKDDLQKNGINVVEYKNGTKVSLDSYAKMAVRSARIESKNIGAFGKALENGTDYVRCTTIFPTCEICAKYQGKIYCISGKDKRFPALFETALHHGYALIHPNCRHEFIPVWLETLDEKELEREIQNSKIVDKDVRSVNERNAYAEWQDKKRQEYHEKQYFEQAKEKLGKAMPYKDLAAFRRSYRTKEGCFAHKRSHNLLRDYKEYQSVKDVLKDEAPKTLAKFQELKYNNSGKYEDLKEYKEYKNQGGKNTFEGFKVVKILKANNVKGSINIPPIAVDINTVKFDNNHINIERKHGVTLEEAKDYIRQSKVSITVWQGKYEKFYSEEGVVYLNRESNTIRTAYKAKEFDKNTKFIIETVKENNVKF